MSVERDGTVVIKAPKNATKAFIDSFYNKNLDWVRQRQAEHKRNSARGAPPTDEEIMRLKRQAKEVLTRKADYYAALMGLKYKSVKITSAKSRWGSCKKDGGICYSYRTMLLSDKCQDYIVVHELSHIVHFNHSAAFWRQVAEVLPDYRQRQAEIKAFSHYDLY